MTKTIEENIEDWLLQKGFPFEIQCSRAFKNHGFKVQQALHYFDDEIKSHREIDICAWKTLSLGNFSFNLTLLIECKTSDVPWLVFTDTHRHPSEQISSLIISKNGEELIKKIENKDKNTFAFSALENEPLGYNFVQMKKNNGEKDKDHAYEAIMQSSKAVMTLKKESDNSQTKFCNLYIPVIIVDKNLFKVSESSVENPRKLTPLFRVKLTPVFQSKVTPAFHGKLTPVFLV